MKAKLALLSGICALLVLSFQNCGKFEGVQNGAASSSSVTDTLDSDQGQLSVSLPSKVEANLVDEVNFEVELQSANFEGNLSLELAPKMGGNNYNKLSAGDLNFSVSPSSLSLSSGQNRRLQAKILVPASSHSFDSSDLELKVYGRSANLIASYPIDLKINPIAEIKMYGNQSSKLSKWSIQSDLNFRTHQPNLKIRFINYDTRASHVVHGTGAIPHGPTGSPLAASSGGRAGGVYEVTIRPTQTQNGSFYYHDLGDSADRFQVNVNTDMGQLALKLVSHEAPPERKPNTEEEESCH